MDVDEITTRMQAELKAADEIAQRAEDDKRDLTGEERAEVEARFKSFEQLRSRQRAAEDSAALTARIKQLGAELGATGGTAGGDGAQLWTPESGVSLGEAFVASAQYKSMIAQAPNGRISDRQRVQSEPFGTKSLLRGSDHTAGAGTLVPPDFRGLVDGLGQFQRPLRVRQLLTSGTTTSDLVEFVRVSSVTNSAKPTPEAKTTGPAHEHKGTSAANNPADDAVGVKPESGLTFQQMTAPVRTLPHWIPATRRALSDASQIRSLIDQWLRYGLDEQLEDQIMKGDGTGENFTGIANTSGIQTEKVGKAGQDTVLDACRRARTKVRVVGRATPSAYVMHPMDWEAIDLLRDNEGRFYWGGPTRLGMPMLWGLPVVESESVPQGTAYVADWRMATLWDREQATITVSDSHADFFIKNLVAVLAEMRAAFGVVRPKAFVKVTLTPTP